MNEDDKPLIWTTHGNLLASSLVHDVQWDDTELYVKCTQSYYLGGELVRQDAHVLAKKGQHAAGQQAGL